MYQCIQATKIKIGFYKSRFFMNVMFVVARNQKVWEFLSGISISFYKLTNKIWFNINDLYCKFYKKVHRISSFIFQMKLLSFRSLLHNNLLHCYSRLLHLLAIYQTKMVLVHGFFYPTRISCTKNSKDGNKSFLSSFCDCFRHL